MHTYSVFKNTATHADVLAAVGAADLLRHLDPRVVDLGDRFEIRLSRPLRRSDLKGVDPGYSYLQRPNKAVPNLPPERVVYTHAEPVDGDAPVPCMNMSQNRMYSILNGMNSYGGPNQVVVAFNGMSQQQWEARVWDCLHGRRDFVFASRLVSLFNPQAARGYALLKPSGTGRNDKTKDRWAEPFHEWLRFRGYFEGSAGWFANGDLHLFCPIPADGPFVQFAAVAAAFRELSLGGAASKVDCRAMLGLTRLLIEKAETYVPPRRWVRHVNIANYKDMGQVHTIMSMEKLALPDWFPLADSRDAQLWLQTLEEHDTVLRRLQDSHSDELALLRQYRRTFQTHRADSIDEFLEFLAAYGILLFGKRAQDHWTLRQLTAEGTTAILEADPELSEILRNQGFIAVAAAIRTATFGAQAARHNGKRAARTVRYGLLTGIRRAGLSGKAELANVASAFVADFNREAAGRCAKGLRSRQITDIEISAFSELLGKVRHTRQLSSLLCGMASCLRGHKVEPAENSEATAELAGAATE